MFLLQTTSKVWIGRRRYLCAPDQCSSSGWMGRCCFWDWCQLISTKEVSKNPKEMISFTQRPLSTHPFLLLSLPLIVLFLHPSMGSRQPADQWPVWPKILVVRMGKVQIQCSVSHTPSFSLSIDLKCFCLSLFLSDSFSFFSLLLYMDAAPFLTLNS